jgi:hypothetical protein
MAVITERGRRVFGLHDERGRWCRRTDEYGAVVFGPTLVSVRTQAKIVVKTALAPELIALKHRHKKRRR